MAPVIRFEAVDGNTLTSNVMGGDHVDRGLVIWSMAVQFGIIEIQAAKYGYE